MTARSVESFFWLLGSSARIARALRTMGLTSAKTESIERRVRRIENDPEVKASLCFHALARERLLWGRPQNLLLIIDPTTKEDQVFMVCVSVRYRGRALPLVWAVWPANVALTGAGFWERVACLMDEVAAMLPQTATVTWLADRAFGTPSFTDLVTARGWHYVVRVQRQTQCQDCVGVERRVGNLVGQQGQQARMRGRVFKKRGWRLASVVVYWGAGHTEPLCLVSDLPVRWTLRSLYQRRNQIEAAFRDYKTSVWRWEQSQVKDIEHIERLLVGMALATWIVVIVGAYVTAELTAKRPTGRSRTRPWDGKHGLFAMGLQRLHEWLTAWDLPMGLSWQLTGWDAPNWQHQIQARQVHAFILGVH